MEPPADKIADWIATDADDDDLELITQAINIRKKILGQIRAATLRRDSRVQLLNLRPKGLVGATGTIAVVNRTRAAVILDADQPRGVVLGRFLNAARTGRPITVPLSCLKEIRT